MAPATTLYHHTIATIALKRPYAPSAGKQTKRWAGGSKYKTGRRGMAGWAWLNSWHKLLVGNNNWRLLYLYLQQALPFRASPSFLRW